ncbi:MAG: PilZ domain-containing protein [Sphingosinicella sp.]|uniref:PilZ domain-containing protein n=1 Tax=Sphingosinicella sp. TaxID=1917971 RepID=UPI00403761BC
MKPASQIALADTSAHVAFNCSMPVLQRVERRTDPRVFTILRVARASVENDTGLCRVQNISDDGMMVITGLVVVEGDPIAVSLSETVCISGQVSWTDGARVGIQFNEAIDCAELLQLLAAERSSGDQRPSRLPTDAVGVATTGSGLQAIRVVDISQVGMKIRHNGGLTLGHPVTIVLENGLQRRGIVRWTDDDLAGLRLLEPIAYQQLESAGSL